MTAYLLQQLLLAAIASTAAISLALLLRALSPRDSVVRYRVLLAFLPVLLLILPLQIAGTEFLDTPRPSAVVYFVDVPSPGRSPAATAALAEPSPHDAPVPISLASTPHPATLPLRAGWLAPMLLPLYLAGVALTAGWTLARAFLASRLVRRSSPVTEPSLLTLWSEVWRAHSKAALPRLLQSSELTAPAVAGVIRPVVIVPSGDARLSDPDGAALVLSHEALHVRRRDALALLGQLLVKAILWFNPLIWRYCRVLEQEREASCDALVVRATGRARSYALALLSYCTPSTTDARALALTPALAHFGRGTKGSILRRIDMLGHPVASVASSRLVRAASIIGLLAAAGGTVALAAACGPEARSHEERVTVAGSPSDEAGSHAAQARDPWWRNGEHNQHGGAANTVDARGVPVLSDVPIVGQFYRSQDAAKPIGTAKRAVIHAPPGPRTPEPGARLMFLRHILAAGGDEAGAARTAEGEYTFTDQESIVSTPSADQVSDRSITGAQFSLSLPEGSNLRAEIDGEQIRSEQSGVKVVASIAKGQIRIVDKEGVTRAVVKPVQVSGNEGELQLVPKIENDTLTIKAQAGKLATQAGELLIAEVSTENGEINLLVRNGLAGDGSRVQADLDLTSGIPKDEKEPPHGSVRYALNQRGPGGAVVVKMQFRYDAAKLQDEQPKNGAPKGAKPFRGSDDAR